ncbi:membrane protein [Marinobacterium nitratireducens]|uniref:Membrane protein n=1 Tax=Marinobacterium nitratireducens TaxID=518897 RepID=A0A917ZML7_9GAMM|nr:DoxX family protein [Marinobacterium nitratireducens]GGO86698.1 membrane protein [Marinobacterium nitratireducens]
MNGFALLVGRILLALIFVSAGWSKIGGFEGTQGYMESMGVPGVLLPLVILLELGGGLAIIVGLGTRTIAVLLALFCIASAVVFHTDFSQPMQSIMFMKNLAIAGGFLVLAASGPGGLSIDSKIGRNW